MTFKVGDRVRRIAEFDDLDLPHGFETNVVEVCDGGFFRHYDAAGDLRYRHEEEYAPTLTDGPVRTVTRREIVEGEFDLVRVHNPGSKYVRIDVGAKMGVAELKAAAAVLLELAGALEDGE